MRHAWVPALLAPTLFLSAVLAIVTWGGPWMRWMGNASYLVLLWVSPLALGTMALLLPKGWLVPLPVIPLSALFFWLWRATLPACETDTFAALGGANPSALAPLMQGCLHLEGLGIAVVGVWTFVGALAGTALRPFAAWVRRRRPPAPAT